LNTPSYRSLAALLAAISCTAGRVAAQSPPVSAASVSTPAPAGAATSLEQRVEALLDRPGGLTADRAAARARIVSSEGQARRAESAAAAERVVQAELGFLPRVAARGTYTRVSDVGVQASGTPLGFTYPRDNFGLQIEVTLPISDYALRLAKQYSSARHSAEAAELMASASVAIAATNARLEYYAWARARLQELVASSGLELSREHLADAKSSFAAGQASLADVMQVEAERADRELMVARARSAIVIEAERLRSLLHDSPRAEYEIGEQLLIPLAPLPGPHALPALVEEALRRRPELGAMHATAAGLSDEAHQQTFGLLPSLAAFGSAEYANPSPRYFPPPTAWKGTWALGAVVSWTSVEAIIAGTSAHAARDHATSADAQANLIRDGIRIEVLQAFRAVQDAELSIAATTRRLSAAEEAYRVRHALFRAAQATSTELSDSELMLMQARFASIDARIDLRLARARLVHATGRDVLER
jgi:outer membrane protein